MSGLSKLDGRLTVLGQPTASKVSTSKSANLPEIALTQPPGRRPTRLYRRNGTLKREASWSIMWVDPDAARVRREDGTGSVDSSVLG